MSLAFFYVPPASFMYHLPFFAVLISLTKHYQNCQWNQVAHKKMQVAYKKVQVAHTKKCKWHIQVFTFHLIVQGIFVCWESHQNHHHLFDDDDDHHHITSSPSDYLHCGLIIQNRFILVLGVVENKSREPVVIIIIITIIAI